MLRIAHRGLWSSDIPENSIAAFEAAVDKGLGVELDVHLSKDGVPIVFHDAHLERMIGDAGYIFEKSAEDLKTLTLAGHPLQSPPSLAETLSVLAPVTPILIEIKTPHRDSPHNELQTAKAVLEVIGASKSAASCMSFSPIMTQAIADTLPAEQVGYLADKGDTFPVQKALDTNAGFAAVWREDVAAARAILGHSGPKLYTWTVKTKDQEKQVAPYVDGVIYEGF
ncbi:MAG: glycerophosphodiester phosphodiesterase family protein [Pseudomonadota bacterium]